MAVVTDMAGIQARSWVFALATLVCAAAFGCKLDGRDVEVSAPDSGDVSAVGTLQPGAGGSSGPADGAGVGPSLPPAEGAGAIGSACRQAADCSAGNCVDGVCCDSACTELCAACNLPGSEGVCSVAPSDPLCPVANCPGQSTECRPLDAGKVGVNCASVGVCRANADCAALPVPQGAPCQQGTGSCDGQGACLVPDKIALGEPCAVDDDCAEGHCVASGQEGARICCDAACDGVCQACSAAGRCEGTPTTDARCAAVSCPADNVCRDYVDAITENLCRSFGQCRSAIDCVSPDFFDSLRSDAQCACDPATGACALAAGTSCVDDGDCASGACRQTAGGNRLCCIRDCDSGLFCSSAGTGCVQCEGNGIECDGNVQRTCDAGNVVTTTCRNGCTPGTGCNALPPVGLLCDAGRCAAGGTCQQDTGGQARCCVRDCAAEGKVCSPAGSCDCPPGQIANGSSCLLQPGDPCQASSQCQAGAACVDGVCCREACGGFCERCQAGTGICQAVPAGQQEADPISGNDCTNGFECTGQRNGCRARTGQPCTSNDGCVSGNCVPAAGGSRVCCSQACSGVRDSCRSSGQGCVECESAAECGNGCNVAQGSCNALLGAGAQCSVASQCMSNRCVPASDSGNRSRCCSNCAAGQLCTPQGQCVNPQSDLGGSCNANADCRQGVCSAGICCERSCDSGCEACNANGACQSNGACDVFSCIAPDPPSVLASVENSEVLGFPGTPEPATGGTIRDGRYTPVRIELYGGATGANVAAFEFQARSVQLAEVRYFGFAPPQSFLLVDMRFAGTYTTNGTTLSLNADLCDTQFNGFTLGTSSMQYTAAANGLRTFIPQDVGTVVINYTRN